MNVLASLQHPYLCKLLGFHAQEGSDERMLIYERLYHGSIDRLLHGGLDGRSMDWPTRMKVALCAAKGLAFLHEEGPFQVSSSHNLIYLQPFRIRHCFLVGVLSSGLISDYFVKMTSIRDNIAPKRNSLQMCL